MRHRDESSAGHRHRRLEEKLFEELGALLRDDVDDPSLERARIVAVSLSVDYRHAKVHYRIDAEREDPRARAAAERAFDRAKGYLRAQIAVALDLKRVPDLRFVYGGAWEAEGPRGGDGGDL